MIQRVIAAVQAARTRPPGPISAAAGAIIAGLGLALVNRYANYLREQVDAAQEELERLDRECVAKHNELAELHNELVDAARQRSQMTVKAEPDEGAGERDV